MTAKLLIREVGMREFDQHNGDFVDLYDGQDEDKRLLQSGMERAQTEGERLCREGNVEAFQVWTLVGEYRRVQNIEVVEREG